MDLLNYLRLRDRVIKNEILGNIPVKDRKQFMKMLNKTFSIAAKRFQNEHVPELIGKRLAKKLAVIV